MPLRLVAIYCIYNYVLLVIRLPRDLNGVGVVYTRFTAKSFLLAASCLLMAGLATRSGLQAAPVYRPSDIFVAGASGHDAFPQILLGLPDSANPDWPEFTPTDVVPDSQTPLQGAIFFTLLVGGILRYLMSDTVHRFFRDTFDPLNWNSYQ